MNTGQLDKKSLVYKILSLQFNLILNKAYLLQHFI